MKFVSLLKDEKGQGMVEYGLILALVAIAAIVALSLLGKNVKNMFGTVNDVLGKVDGGAVSGAVGDIVD